MNEELRRKRMAEEQFEEKQKRRFQAELKEIENKALSEAGFTFNTDDLSNRALFINLLKGNFDKISLDRNTIAFSGLMKHYRNEYATVCAYALPADKVEIFEKECAREAYTVNGWGVKYNRRCIEWRNIPTNLYARRELNNAVELVASHDHQNAIGLFWQGVASGSFHHFNAQEIAISSLKEEITTLLQINDCNSKALRRFEGNLICFAQGRTSLKIEGFAE